VTLDSGVSDGEPPCSLSYVDGGAKRGSATNPAQTVKLLFNTRSTRRR
jgi:hypothetical protein